MKKRIANMANGGKVTDYGDDTLNAILNGNNKLSDDDKADIARRFNSGFKADDDAPSPKPTPQPNIPIKKYADGTPPGGASNAPDDYSDVQQLIAQNAPPVSSTADQDRLSQLQSLLAQAQGQSQPASASPDNYGDVQQLISQNAQPNQSSANLLDYIKGTASQPNSDEDLASISTPVPTSTGESEGEAAAKGSDAAARGAETEAQSKAVPVSNTDALGNMLNRLYGSSNLSDASAYNQAVGQRQNMVQAALGLQAADQIGNAFNKGRGLYEKPDYSNAEMILGEANKPITDLMNKQVMATEKMGTAIKASDFLDQAKLQDPTSDVSKAFRGIATSLNPKLANDPNFDKMSAQTLKMAEPMVDSYGKLAYMQAFKNEQIQRQQDTKEQGYLMRGNMQLQQNIAGRGASGPSYKIEQASQRLLGILNDPTVIKTGKITPEQQHTASMDLATIYSNGGVGTEAGQKGLMPPTLQQWAAKGQEFLTGNPANMDIRGSIDQYRDMAEKARQIALQSQLQTAQNISKGLKPVFVNHPDYSDTLESSYIQPIKERMNQTPSDFKSTANTPAAAATNKPQTVVQNGHTYNLQPDGSYK